MANPSSSLKSIPSFESLTSAESAIFSRVLEEWTCRAGKLAVVDESLLVVRKGRFRLNAEKGSEHLVFAEIGPGDLVGELPFFESDPVAVRVEAESDSTCFAFDRRALKNTFRYCRTGAVKFLVVFARSLSHKIRSANDVLQRTKAKKPRSGNELRPVQLDPLELQRLMTFSVTRTYREGEVLFREGDVGRELFIIGDGEVEILKEESSSESIVLARLGSGESFGEMAFVDERPRSATAVARSSLHVHVLPSGSLDKAVDYNVGIALYLTGVICRIMARRLNITLMRLVAS